LGGGGIAVFRAIDPVASSEASSAVFQNLLGCSSCVDDAAKQVRGLNLFAQAVTREQVILNPNSRAALLPRSPFFAYR
jgi:hypothetical protein